MLLIITDYTTLMVMIYIDLIHSGISLIYVLKVSVKCAHYLFVSKLWCCVFSCARSCSLLEGWSTMGRSRGMRECWRTMNVPWLLSCSMQSTEVRVRKACKWNDSLLFYFFILCSFMFCQASSLSFWYG